MTNSAIYFKSSAETSFQYLTKDHEFIEDHTALSDAIIESQILAKALKKGKVEPNIEAFPFRNLGKTYEYAMIEKKNKYMPIIVQALCEYITNNCGVSAYWTKMENLLQDLENYIKIKGL